MRMPVRPVDVECLTRERTFLPFVPPLLGKSGRAAACFQVPLFTRFGLAMCRCLVLKCLQVARQAGNFDKKEKCSAGEFP